MTSRIYNTKKFLMQEAPSTHKNKMKTMKVGCWRLAGCILQMLGLFVMIRIMRFILFFCFMVVSLYDFTIIFDFFMVCRTMLNDKECMCITKFFEDFPSADLFALALLISKRNLQPVSRQDALNIICQHTDCIESVLEKKKISKKYLSEYLHKCKVSVVQTWDKPGLIRKVLEYWNCPTKLSPNTSISEQNKEIRSEPLDTKLNSSISYYEQLTTKFSEWFYALINDQDLLNLRPEHFFIDAQMKLVLRNGNSTNEIQANNSADAVQALRELQSKYRLKFLPNLSSDALKYQIDIHGQVMLMVGGTLHSSNSSQVVGVFEQMFLLIRDVSDNENWKIRNSQIMLRSMSNSIEHSSASTEDTLPICSYS